MNEFEEMQDIVRFLSNKFINIINSNKQRLTLNENENSQMFGILNDNFITLIINKNLINKIDKTFVKLFQMKIYDNLITLKKWKTIWKCIKIIDDQKEINFRFDDKVRKFVYTRQLLINRKWGKDNW